MTAKEYLSQYQDSKKELAAQIENHKEIRSLAEKSTPSTECGGIGIVSDRVGNGAAKLVDLVREIEEKKVRCCDIMGKVLVTIEKVRNPHLRLLLTMRYIRGYTHEEIAEKLLISARHEMRIHKKAIAEVEKILRSSGAESWKIQK